MVAPLLHFPSESRKAEHWRKPSRRAGAAAACRRPHAIRQREAFAVCGCRSAHGVRPPPLWPRSRSRFWAGSRVGAGFDCSEAEARRIATSPLHSPGGSVARLTRFMARPGPGLSPGPDGPLFTNHIRAGPEPGRARARSGRSRAGPVMDR
jgi:hypothetical protein